MESGSHKHTPADRPDPRSIRDRLDALEQRDDALHARLEELEAIVRVLAFTLGWDADALRFPPDETP